MLLRTRETSRTPIPPAPGPRWIRRGGRTRSSPPAGEVQRAPPAAGSAPRSMPRRAPPPSPPSAPFDVRFSGNDARPRRASRSSGNSLAFEVGHLRSELGAVTDAELLQDVGDVALDGLSREEQLLRNFRIRRACCDQPCDFPLALCQLPRSRRTAPGSYAQRPQFPLGQLLRGEGAPSRSRSRGYESIKRAAPVPALEVDFVREAEESVPTPGFVGDTCLELPCFGGDFDRFSHEPAIEKKPAKPVARVEHQARQDAPARLQPDRARPLLGLVQTARPSRRPGSRE